MQASHSTGALSERLQARQPGPVLQVPQAAFVQHGQQPVWTAVVLSCITVLTVLGCCAAVYMPELLFGHNVVSRVHQKMLLKQQRSSDPASQAESADDSPGPVPGSLHHTFGGRGLSLERLQKSIHFMQVPDEWDHRIERGTWLLIKCRDWSGHGACPFVRKLVTQLLSDKVRDVRILLLQVMDSPYSETVNHWIDEHSDIWSKQNLVPSTALMKNGKVLKQRIGPFANDEEAQEWIHTEPET